MSKILIVDDDLKILGIFREVLQNAGHEVRVADSGKKCLEMLELEKPELVLMDVMMPEMDGWETVQKIKEDSSNKDVKISMLTVKSEDKDRAKSLLIASADWHITKPISNDKLVETVDWLLKQ